MSLRSSLRVRRAGPGTPAIPPSSNTTSGSFNHQGRQPPPDPTLKTPAITPASSTARFDTLKPADRADSADSQHDPRQPSPLTAQLARGLSAAAAQSHSTGKPVEITLRLQPASLGHVKVRIAFDRTGRTGAGGGLSARFEVASPEARRAVNDSLADLRTALDARGINIDNLDVKLARADPLAFLSGTPYAEQGPTPEWSFGERSGQDARQSQAQWGGAGSTDAPRQSRSSHSAAAERPVQPSRSPYTLSRDHRGEYRLAIDAIA